jgi:chromatin segregation and condensation protein Rec8/ScpA/Scc1 (kleisin family)
MPEYVIDRERHRINVIKTVTERQAEARRERLRQAHKAIKGNKPIKVEDVLKDLLEELGYGSQE